MTAPKPPTPHWAVTPPLAAQQRIGVIGVLGPGVDDDWITRVLGQLHAETAADGGAADRGGPAPLVETAIAGPTLAAPTFVGVIVNGDVRAWYDELAWAVPAGARDALLLVADLQQAQLFDDRGAGVTMGHIRACGLDALAVTAPIDAAGDAWALYYDIGAARWRSRRLSQAGAALQGDTAMATDYGPADWYGGPVTDRVKAERGTLDDVIGAGAVPGDPALLLASLQSISEDPTAATAVGGLVGDWNRTESGDATGVMLYLYDESEQLFYPGDDNEVLRAPKHFKDGQAMSLFRMPGMDLLVVYWAGGAEEVSVPLQGFAAATYVDANGVTDTYTAYSQQTMRQRLPDLTQVGADGLIQLHRQLIGESELIVETENGPVADPN